MTANHRIVELIDRYENMDFGYHTPSEIVEELRKLLPNPTATAHTCTARCSSDAHVPAEPIKRGPLPDMGVGAQEGGENLRRGIREVLEGFADQLDEMGGEDDHEVSTSWFADQLRAYLRMPLADPADAMWQAAQSLKGLGRGGSVEIGGFRIEVCDERGQTETTKALEKALEDARARLRYIASAVETFGSADPHEAVSRARAIIAGMREFPVDETTKRADRFAQLDAHLREFFPDDIRPLENGSIDAVTLTVELLGELRNRRAREARQNGGETTFGGMTAKGGGSRAYILREDPAAARLRAEYPPSAQALVYWPGDGDVLVLDDHDDPDNLRPHFENLSPLARELLVARLTYFALMVRRLDHPAFGEKGARDAAVRWEQPPVGTINIPSGDDDLRGRR